MLCRDRYGHENGDKTSEVKAIYDRGIGAVSIPGRCIVALDNEGEADAIV